ncbi:hypothetical protein [Telluribacter humicola]|uniref:hypothetical protein n=1 Tax=Telluribacter humicola TaxID=1720261 RepID=UPI001A97C5CE|nr:hypothetical protein [Telluribacter humicola]
MPYKSKQPGSASKGAPTQAEKSKASSKIVDSDTLDERQEIRDKYTDKNGQPDPDVVPVNNPNRNTDKEKTDQPAYGGS